jgi:hypothetical protein
MPKRGLMLSQGLHMVSSSSFGTKRNCAATCGWVGVGGRVGGRVRLCSPCVAVVEMTRIVVRVPITVIYTHTHTHTDLHTHRSTHTHTHLPDVGDDDASAGLDAVTDGTQVHVIHRPPRRRAWHLQLHLGVLLVLDPG